MECQAKNQLDFQAKTEAKKSELTPSVECDGRDYLKVSKVARGKVEPFSEQDRNILMLYLTRSRVEERINDERVSQNERLC